MVRGLSNGAVIDEWISDSTRLHSVAERLKGAGYDIDVRVFLAEIAREVRSTIPTVEVRGFLDRRLDEVLAKLMYSAQPSRGGFLLGFDGDRERDRLPTTSRRRSSRSNAGKGVPADTILILGAQNTLGDVRRVATLINYVNLRSSPSPKGSRRIPRPDFLPRLRRRLASDHAAQWHALWLAGLVDHFPRADGRDPVARKRTRKIEILKSDFEELKGSIESPSNPARREQ